MWRAEDELKGVTAWGVKLLSSLVVQHKNKLAFFVQSVTRINEKLALGR